MTAAPWSHEETLFIAQHLGLSPQEGYSLLLQEFGPGRTYQAFKRKRQRILANGASPTVVQDLASQQDTLELELDLGTWLDSVLTSFTPRPRRKEPKAKAGDKALVVFLSDTHFGKLTRAGYCIQEAEIRLDALANRLDATGYGEIVVVLGGDIIEGEGIYKTQAHHLEYPVIQQVYHAVGALNTFLLTLLEKWPQARIRVETVPGNHGRVSKHSSELSNWDNMVYMTLALLCERLDDTRLTFNCNLNEFLVFPVLDQTILLVHEGPKHASTPATIRRLAGWAVSKQYTIMLHGHWHSWHVGNWMGRLVLANGSMCGPDDLSERIACEEQAKQGIVYLQTGRPPVFSYWEWEDLPFREDT